MYFYNIALRHSSQTAAGLDSDVRAFGYFLHSQLSPYLCGYSLSVFRSLFTLQMLAVCPHLLLRFWNLKIPHCLPPAKSVSDGQNEREMESLWGHSCRLLIVCLTGAHVARGGSGFVMQNWKFSPLQRYERRDIFTNKGEQPSMWDKGAHPWSRLITSVFGPRNKHLVCARDRALSLI